MNMKKLVVTGLGLMLAIVAASPDCGAQVFQFNGLGDGSSFLDPDNWDMPGVPGVGNQALINDDFVVTYGTSDVTTVASLIVGADWPVTGPNGTAGTLNMSDGSLIVTGGGDAFQIGRACCDGTGVMNMTGDAVLEIQGSDPTVGTRDRGELHIGPNASVISTRPDGTYWRIGNFGPNVDPFNPPGGLQGDGLLNVEGSFSAKVIFIGAQDGDGELRVSGNGSVTLTDNLVPSINTGEENRSALVHMIGSNASLNALNLESANGLTEVHNQFEFTADSGGVSPITLVPDMGMGGAVNITNNDLVVNLDGFPLAIGETLLLFDAAPDQIFGEFASSIVNDGTVTEDEVPHIVIYDQVNGDILVQAIPEPSALILLGLGMVMVISAKRRESR